MKRNLLSCILAGAFLVPSVGYAQTTTKVEEKETVKKDSLSNEKEESYEVLLKGAISKKGLFTVHKVKGDYYFEIPSSLWGKDILVVNKISSVPSQVNEAGINKGMNYENKLIRFYLDKESKKVRVKTYDPKISVNENDNIYASVKDNFVESIIDTFKVKAFGADGSAVFKVNDIFNGSSKTFNNLFDNIGLGGSVRTKDSYIEEIKSFQNNIVVKSVSPLKFPKEKHLKKRLI